ncbi:hypothetical protein TWF281_008169 [Arthrobotrys megalospora]
MAPKSGSGRTYTCSLSCFIIITVHLLSPAYAYWDEYATGNGEWFRRRAEYAGRIHRTGAADIGSCHKMLRVDDPPLDGAVFWNRDVEWEPAILALAFYADTLCGLSGLATNQGKPLAVMIADKKRLRGLHISNFKKLDGVIPAALIRRKTVRSVKAIKVSDQVKTGGFLRGIPARELPNSLVYWDARHTRHVVRNAVIWANGEFYESLSEPSFAHRFLREVVERVVNSNSATPRTNSETLVKRLNKKIGRSYNDLLLPPPGPDLDLRLDGKMNDDYGRPIHEFPLLEVQDASGSVRTIDPNNEGPMLITVPPSDNGGLERAQTVGLVQIGGGRAPMTIGTAPENQDPELEATGNPGPRSSNQVDWYSVFDYQNIPEELRRQLMMLEVQVDVVGPGTGTPAMAVPIDQLTESFNAAPDKKQWLENKEATERQNMRGLLILRDWVDVFEGKKQHLFPWTNADAESMFPGLRAVFDKAPNKRSWYTLVLHRQNFNMRALKAATKIYNNWAETEEGYSVMAMQGSRSETVEEGASGDNNFLEQEQQNAALEEGQIEIEEEREEGEEGVQEEGENDQSPALEYDIDSYFTSGHSPTIHRSDEVNLPDIPKLQFPVQEPAIQVQQQPTFNAPDNGQRPQPQGVNQPNPQAVNQLNPQDVLHLQTEGIDPNNPLLISDFDAYFNPESRAFQDILRFNPGLIRELEGSNGGLLGIPDFGIRQYVPPELDLDSSSLFDTPSEGVSSMWEEEEEEEEEGIEESRSGERGVEEVVEEGERSVSGEPVEEEVAREEVVEEEQEEVLQEDEEQAIEEGVEGEVGEEEREEVEVDEALVGEVGVGGGREGVMEEERVEESEDESEQGIPEQQFQAPEPIMLGGRPADDVLGEVQRQLQYAYELPRRSGRQPPRQAPVFEPTFTPKQTGRRSRRRPSDDPLQMADVFIDIPLADQQFTDSDNEEPSPQRIDFWDRPVEGPRRQGAVERRQPADERIEEPSPEYVEYWDRPLKSWRRNQ